MKIPEGTFYVTGGTLRHDAPSYISRRADTEIYESLKQGEFCYVLTARQMGKSSLMVRTAARLRTEGTDVVVLDLTTIGQNLSFEQWYDGLTSLMSAQLNLETEIETFWAAHARLGSLQRWMAALKEVILTPANIAPAACKPLVIFIDEIDMVRSLPFSTDEFFASIRACHNRRTQEPEFNRLTFCLLGVASPTSLIRDTRMTPFNIGRRIELKDFTLEEVAPLVRGLAGEEHTTRKMLQRVYYWTDGHPYLTQRLCRGIAENSSTSNPKDVDRFCKDLFLSVRARERDDNLVFVRERLLNSDVERASLLDQYGKVLKGKHVADDETNSLTSMLKLSGVTRTEDGRLRVRNRIYRRVFNPEWITSNMPDAEKRRQWVALKRGVIGAALVAILILGVLFGLGILRSPILQAGEVMVVQMQGTVVMLPKGATNWVAIRTNQFLIVGDRLRTATNSSAALRWSDQSIFRIGANAEVEITPGKKVQTFIPGLRYYHRDLRIITGGATSGVKG